MDPVREIIGSKKEEELDNHIKLMRTSSREAGVRTEAKSMAVTWDQRGSPGQWANNTGGNKPHLGGEWG